MFLSERRRAEMRVTKNKKISLAHTDPGGDQVGRGDRGEGQEIAVAAGLPCASFGAVEGVRVGLGCRVRGGGLDWELRAYQIKRLCVRDRRSPSFLPSALV
jgi:hypothetical protein